MAQCATMCLAHIFLKSGQNRICIPTPGAKLVEMDITGHGLVIMCFASICT